MLSVRKVQILRKGWRTYGILHYLCKIQVVTFSIMKEFFQLMRRFVSPYKKYVCWAVLLNILSAIFNVFSFSLLITILNILFKTNAQEKVYLYID